MTVNDSEVSEKDDKSFLDWRQETTCTACHGKAYYLRNKRRKLQINCENCGHFVFQKSGGQEWLEKRLASGDSEDFQNMPESIEKAIPEAVPEVAPVNTQEFSEISEKPKGKKRGLYCGLMFITGGLGVIAWRLKRAAAQVSS